MCMARQTGSRSCAVDFRRIRPFSGLPLEER